jgi:hypothetical protein
MTNRLDDSMEHLDDDALPDAEWDAIARELRREVRVDPIAVRRVMLAVAADRSADTPAVEAARVLPISTRRLARWLREPRTVRFTPLGALAAAAAVLVLLAMPWKRATAPAGGVGSPDTMVGGLTPVTAASSTVSVQQVQFAVTARSASRVSLVGDFNDWSATATPLQQSSANGVWTVIVPLAPGRHRYAFVVDGKTWVADDGAARAPDSDFDAPSSVVLVGEKRS